MECPECQFENPDGMKFCGDCGAKFESICPQCHFKSPPNFNFCGKCGHKFSSSPPLEKKGLETDGERKHVTVLFSDLTGYTSISERLDPEKLKEIMERIFTEAGKIVTKYEATVEKFIGDEIMILVGVPKTHEDDPVRAINIALEIHDRVSEISDQFVAETGVNLKMHSGASTGLVVTGEKVIGKSRHGLTGDTINIAKRLTTLASSGEILVGPETFRQASGYFDFEALEPLKIKGKVEPLNAFKVLSAKEQPSKTHNLTGLRSKLIGRNAEMAHLKETIEDLKQGKGNIVSICGDIGTGKSRLVEELKAMLDLRIIQWRYGCSYPYAQNIPYFPVIDLLNQAFQIEESDSQDKIRRKIELGIKFLGEEIKNIAPFIGSLFSLSYPESENINPQLWKIRLHEAIKTILAALTKKAPTVICIEDLHWADPSTIELLRFILSEFKYPALFLFAYRPSFTLFNTYQMEAVKYPYQEIRLQDLSTSDAQNMMESLLETDSLPSALEKFIQQKVEGNPFYLEEFINSLIESETLFRHEGKWHLTKSISQADISPTIHGIISSRLDRLENDTKKILQEASVIGRSFLYDILQRVTAFKTQIDQCLRGLEQYDLIRTRSIEPELEYIFKHALTQEVVYNGLLKKQRQIIHERIALVMEKLFHDRLFDFYESLAYHFTEGLSIEKAVDYLVKSGAKSHRRWALEESNQYYKTALGLLTSKQDKTEEEEKKVVDLIIEWGYVHNSRGSYKEQEELLKSNLELAESINDKKRLGMFYAWLGWTLRSREKLREAYEYLLKALSLGEVTKDQKNIGFACSWLSWTCSDLGLLDKAVEYGQRALQISTEMPEDVELRRYTLAGLGVAYYFRGECLNVEKMGELLLHYGQEVSDPRCISMSYNCKGISNYISGDMRSAIERFKKAIEVAEDIATASAARLLLGMSYLADGHVDEAESVLKNVMNVNAQIGLEFLGTPARSFNGIVLIAKGDLNRGVKTVEETLNIFKDNESRYRYISVNHALGKMYLQIVLKTGPRSLSFLARNLTFLVKNLPFADRHAEDHLREAIKVAKEIGSKGVCGQASLDMALLHKSKGRLDQAKNCIQEAIQMFEMCGAKMYLDRANKELAEI